MSNEQVVLKLHITARVGLHDLKCTVD